MPKPPELVLCPTPAVSPRRAWLEFSFYQLASCHRTGATGATRRVCGPQAPHGQLLCGIGSLQLPLSQTEYAENIYWVYGLVLDDCVPADAQRAIHRLAQRNIGTRPFFWPMHEQPVFQRMSLFLGETYPVAERLARRGFYIPSGLGLKDEQLERVATEVRSLFA